jgi:hypothetical protein
VAGLLGSIYTAEIKTAFPFYWGTPRAWVWSAFLFWGVLIFTGLTFGVRQWAVDCARQRAEKRLRKTSRDLVRAIRTMPPIHFLANFGDAYREAEQATWQVFDATSPASNDALVKAIRHVLRGFATLARHFDGSKDNKLYAANIMVFIKSESLDRERVQAIKRRLNLCEPETSVEDLYGVLDLRRELSATATQQTDDEWDTTLVPLALAIPKEILVESRDRDHAVWRIMPGAPIAFTLKEADSYTDTTELGRWCDHYGDFTDKVKLQVDKYFDPATTPPVRSFISLPLVWGEGEDEDPHEVPLAVLNIHRDEPNLLKEDGEPVRHFVAVTRPLRLLLMRLLAELHRRESEEHGTWNVLARGEDELRNLQVFVPDGKTESDQVLGPGVQP